MKKIIFYLAAIVAFCGMASCTSDEPGAIALSKGQSSKLSLYADDTTGEICFTAEAEWSAWTSTSSGGGAEEIEWLTINGLPSGFGGECVLSFSLDYNDTGASRTAYIVLFCEGEKVSVRITQTSGVNDGDVPVVGGNAIGRVCITREEHDLTGYDSDSYPVNAILEYEHGKIRRIITTCRNDIAYDSPVGQDAGEMTTRNLNKRDNYCISEIVTEFDWGLDYVRAKVVSATDTYYPSGRVENSSEEEYSESYVELRNGLAAEGWYRFDDNDAPVDWKAYYNSDGRLARTQNNDMPGSPYIYDFTWSDRLLSRIDENDGYSIAFQYDNENIANLYSAFDLNWFLINESEILDFACGDINRIWALCGLMGERSRLLMTSCTETHQHNNVKTSWNLDYKEHTSGRTVVRVTNSYDGIPQCYTDYTIEYQNIG